MANIKKIKRLRGGDLQVAAQANVQIDAEIGQKDHFRYKPVSNPEMRIFGQYQGNQAFVRRRPAGRRTSKRAD
ncbi:hypothetical protein [Desulfatiglans anilini]|uniref:hypothetical protein n=1 Tax=Desulfatiglans anilini TaxID=90728 RepID=UPI00129486F6|nr:hypothetical protein [Desulfatiglans anilini]